ncbi:hypothetical protein [Chlorogloeopsis fritschii]|uniref:hypothetical protein n=1 Tax=Chlorogloeopsis fritschii TaxID=1124 RepID=UPI00036FB8BB|nr:hypothetical protein [Chlorogloeopsis fritschii]
MNLIHSEDRIPLKDLPPGSLFQFGKTIALKSEYVSDNGRIEAFIVGTGNTFLVALHYQKK